MGPYPDAPFRKPLDAKSTGNTDGRCEPAGKMTAACRVLIPSVLDLRCIVGMAGTWAVPKVVIVTGTDVGIADDGRDRRAAGKPI